MYRLTWSPDCLHSYTDGTYNIYTISESYRAIIPGYFYSIIRSRDKEELPMLLILELKTMITTKLEASTIYDAKVEAQNHANTKYPKEVYSLTSS